MDPCSVCLETINENAKTLVCGHTFHLECILEWFVKSEQCPMCRACQKDDPFIKFKHKLVNEKDDFCADDEFSHYRECLREHITSGDPEFAHALRRAMAYELTMEDLEGPCELSHRNAADMILYQETHKSFVAIIDNWRFTECENGMMRRVNHYESTLEDLMGHFLMSRDGAEAMLEYQSAARSVVVSMWGPITSMWKERLHLVEEEERAGAMRRALANESTLDDLVTNLDMGKHEAFDALAYQHYLVAEGLMKMFSEHLPLASGAMKEAIKRAMDMRSTEEELVNILGRSKEQAVSILEYQQVRRVA